MSSRFKSRYVSFTKLLTFGYCGEECINLANLKNNFQIIYCFKSRYVSFTKLLTFGYYGEKCINLTNLSSFKSREFWY
ncbi:hypothetical protein BpHYR1_051647 [Brachionus plicatilis]|uniref:Uncharacterized protein n=1 Tax=Brachionus plicatilis TaxID=10195 RepID=A0A3M7RKE3_BRAPC|nr:hypothetical protein BpHYR1_051647 [Brachionus plicatilis]